jgi:hypothetical protein
MKKLFWTQNKKTSLSNTVITSNGDILPFDKSNDITVQIVDDLLEFQEISKLKYQGNNLYIRKHPKKGYFISSNFSNKDDNGRKMAFMFFTQNTKSKEVLQDLVFFSGLINRNLQEKDIVIMENELNTKNKKSVFTLIAIFVVVLSIYMLWKKMS